MSNPKTRDKVLTVDYNEVLWIEHPFGNHYYCIGPVSVSRKGEWDMYIPLSTDRFLHAMQQKMLNEHQQQIHPARRHEAIKEVHCKWTHTDRHTKQEEEKCKIGPIYKKIILDENSYANAGMSSLAYYQKAMFFLSFSFCSFFVFWWILISLSLGLFSRHAFENHLQHADAGRVNA